ncbi:MAG: hypothetical protein HUU16_20765, partial [Candidatus Omnitrophica bacterium]|nr:hypothetical protein [Candidatus Omnitrophota bacterium]
MIRAQLPGFYEESKGTEFLEAASVWILSRTAELPEESRNDRLAIEALALEQNGKLDEAIQVIRENLWSDLSMRIRVASMAAANGDIETASGIYTEMEKVSPGKFLEPWGSMYADLGMTEQALAVWSRIPSGERSPELGYRRWGQLLKSKGYLKEAVEAFKEGVSKTSQPALFAQDLLDVSISLGDVEGALTAYQVLKLQTARVSGIWSPERLVDQLRRTQQMDLFRRRMNEVLDASHTVTAPWRDFAVELQTELALQLNDREVLAGWLATPPKAVAAYWAKDPARRMNHIAGIAVDLSLQGENELASRFFAEVDRGFLASRPNALEAAARSAGAIGDLSGSLQFWRTLRDLPQSPLDQRLRATLAMARLYLDAHRPGRAIDLLSKVSQGANLPSYQAELTFLQALSYTQLHEKSKALPLLQEVSDGLGSHSAEARYWLAEWALWQREWGDAKLLYGEVLTSDPGQELANDTLWRLRYLRGLEEEQLPLFSMATFFEGSGDWKEAEANYRNLAAALGGSDSELVDWIYYRVGKILIQSGRKEDGLAQWRILSGQTKNATLLRRIEYETAALAESADAKAYETIVLNNANTLIGDLAREKMQEKLAREKAPEAEKVIP